MNIQRGG